jgi:hypothetical protein
MEKYNKSVLFAMLLFIFTGCKTIPADVPVEIDQVIIGIVEIPDKEFDYIIMSGYIYQSYVKKTIIEYDYNDIENVYIKIYTEPSRSNRNSSKSFGKRFVIEKHINGIYFGNNNVLIWERKSTEILLQREKLLELQKYTSYNDIVEQFGEPDAHIGSGNLIIQYILSNNRRAILHFGPGRYGLLQLSEVFGFDESNANVIFSF